MADHRYAALLRAVNVGGTGKLPMAELKELCARLGFAHVRTYIASGNVVFTAELDELEVRRRLEAALEKHAGKRIRVHVRTHEELTSIVDRNPFPDAAGDRLMIVFLSKPPAADAGDAARNVRDERIAVGARELYVHYPSGSGRSKLVLPSADDGTARNFNTVRALARLTAELP